MHHISFVYCIKVSEIIFIHAASVRTHQEYLGEVGAAPATGFQSRGDKR